MPLLVILAVAVLAWLASKGTSGSGRVDASGTPLPLGLDVSGDAGQPRADIAAPVDAGSQVASYGLDSIVQAVQHFESGGRQFDANGNVITSPRGAIGIMQLEPGTAAQLGVNPYDEQQNIAGGTIYLQQLFARFGNWYDALVAYNWGPGNAEKALDGQAVIPPEVDTYATNVLSYAGVDASNG